MNPEFLPEILRFLPKRFEMPEQRWLWDGIFLGSQFPNPKSRGFGIFFPPKNPEAKIPKNPKSPGLGFFFVGLGIPTKKPPLDRSLRTDSFLASLKLSKTEIFGSSHVEFYFYIVSGTMTIRDGQLGLLFISIIYLIIFQMFI